MSRFPSIRADETYNGCSTINMQKAANNTDLLMLQDVVKQLYRTKFDVKMVTYQ
uniref:Uncharacterized protein n=1 Tax=Oryza sativa subsp. japonica TaxID=39947 RepID=Q6K1T9_ORYSJ|nr:hypothetical protein [Oryza sativa Japonica Group]